jgi:hypothetical protein
MHSPYLLSQTDSSNSNIAEKFPNINKTETPHLFNEKLE